MLDGVRQREHSFDMEQISVAAVIDARGMVTGWSEGARRLTGYRAQEAVGRPAWELLAEEVSPEAVAALTGTAVLRHRDGSSHMVSLMASPVLGADGAPTGFVVTAR